MREEELSLGLNFFLMNMVTKKKKKKLTELSSSLSFLRQRTGGKEGRRI